MWRISEEAYRDIVERAVHELVVMSEIDKNTYVIKNILWDEKSRSNGPMVVSTPVDPSSSRPHCRFLHQYPCELALPDSHIMI